MTEETTIREAIIQLNKVNKELKTLVKQRAELLQKLTSLPKNSYTITGDDGVGLRLDIKRVRRLDLKKVQDHYKPQAHPDFYQLALNTKVIRAAVPADELEECETESQPFATVTKVKDE